MPTSAAEQLRLAEGKARRYQTESYYEDNVLSLISGYAEAYGGDWSHGFQIISRDPNGPDVFETKHMIRFGPSDLTSVEKHFGVSLPDSAHLFYQQVTECVLTLREPLVVLSPEAIIKHEEWHRDIYRQCDIDLPIQVIRFVKIPNEPRDFAFRQNTKDKRWRVMHVSSTDDQPQFYHSSDCDGLEDDEDIDAWMERMLSSDGFPLLKDGEPYERPSADRIL
jgi:hypothetical protein